MCYFIVFLPERTTFTKGKNMRAFFVDGNKIEEGIPATAEGLEILPDTEERLPFFRNRAWSHKDPEIRDGRVFQCEVRLMGTLADTSTPQVFRPGGISGQEDTSGVAFVIWKVSTEWTLFPNARGETAEHRPIRIAETFGVVSSPVHGRAGLYVMKPGDHCLALGPGGEKKFLRWDGVDLGMHEPKPWDGPGSSKEKAVVLKVLDSPTAILAEHGFISIQCGAAGTHWQLAKQRLLKEGKKTYDVVEIGLPDGSTQTFYFDISTVFP